MTTVSSAGQIGDTSTAGVASLSGRVPEPLTSFIGRDRELADLLALLQREDVRLLTLTGPGGIGKTRLAISLAQTAAGQAGVSAVFVPLASVPDASLVAPTIGAAFGLSDSGDQSLAERLPAIVQNQPLLLILDNFEHLVEAAPLTTLLLTACPTLQIVATSRRSLRVSGETAWPVPPMDSLIQDGSRESVERTDSFQLFVERSGQELHATTSAEGQEETDAIGQICRRLDGLPLAIELAAARTRVLSPAELLARLDHRLALLTDGPLDAPVRLRSMRDAIAWSYDLLGDDEQRLLRTLSVFSGGFTLDAVEAIAPDDEKPLVIDLLTRLIDHSLVQRTATPYGTARFTMLETIREFALDALKARDEEPSARNRHLRWMVEFVGSPTPDRFYELRGPADPSFYAELDNLRVAFNWAIDHHDAPRAAQLAWGLLRIWWHFGLTSEALESVQRLVDHPEGLDPVVNATVNEWLSAFACHHGDNERARAAATEALAKFRELDHTLGINISLATLGEATWWSDPGRAVELFSQAVEIGRGLEDRRVLAWDLHWRSYAFIALGDAQRALIDLNEAVALFEQFQVHDEVRFDQSLALNYLAWAWGLCGRIDLATDCVARGLEFSRQYNVSVGMFAANRVLGELARARGDLEQAFAHLRECLLTAHRDALESWRVCAIIQIAMVAQAAGDWQRAARLFGYAGSQWLRHNYAESSRSVSTWGYTVDLTRHALGDDAFAAGFEAGGLLTSAEAFIEASSITVPEIARSVHDSPLTRRETEVLAHLAQGKTNQEIATNLFVGKSTVDTHVAHILTKLGVESRREAINVARKRGLLNEQSAAEAAPDPSQRC